jgi:hypothetical protein
MNVKDLTQTRAGGIHVSLEPGGKVSREEAYLGFKFTWLGKVVNVDVTADRYMASHWDGNDREDRLTPWRVIIRSAYGSSLTDLSRRAADAVIEPLVQTWIASSDYIAARQLAYSHAIGRAIGEERFDATRARRVLDAHSHELTLADKARLQRACGLLAQFLDALK